MRTYSVHTRTRTLHSHTVHTHAHCCTRPFVRVSSSGGSSSSSLPPRPPTLTHTFYVYAQSHRLVLVPGGAREWHYQGFVNYFHFYHHRRRKFWFLPFSPLPLQQSSPIAAGAADPCPSSAACPRFCQSANHWSVAFDPLFKSPFGAASAGYQSPSSRWR